MIDLRSDTVTLPTPAMRAAIAEAALGDDGYRDDPTVNALEELAARLVGKEAALLVPSGTMGNLAALLALAGRGEQVLLEARSHIARSEMGGIATLAGLPHQALPGHRGAVAPEVLETAVAGSQTAGLRPTLLCLETTHNAAGGAVLPLDYLAAIRATASRLGLRIHLDGARLFNAAVALGVPAHEIARHADTVTFCLSKGLSAPAGALLCGPADVIARARLFRRMLGGTMRQSGVLAAAGIVALQQGVDRLVEDHRRAKRLAEGFAALAPTLCDPAEVETNILFIDVRYSGRSARDWVRELEARRVVCRAMDSHRMRLVVHAEIDDADIEAAIAAATEVWSAAPSPATNP
jgi:threonine aldolase